MIMSKLWLTIIFAILLLKKEFVLQYINYLHGSAKEDFIMEKIKSRKLKLIQENIKKMIIIIHMNCNILV